MTGIGTSNYNDSVRQAMRRGQTNAQGTADRFVTTAFGAVIHSISYAPSTAERTESKHDINSRWTDERLYTIDESSPEGYKVNRAALAAVKERLREEGADKRTPTHEITEEQLDWLASRYDLEFLSVCSFTHPEYGNFMLDLAYLNVFSLDEVENMYGVVPTGANGSARLYYHGDPVTGKGAGYIGSDGNVYEDPEDLYTKAIMEYLRVKYTGRTESEYGRMAEDMKAQRAERMLIVEEIFARVSELRENNTDLAKPDIEDASGKLKEDFGALISR